MVGRSKDARAPPKVAPSSALCAAAIVRCGRPESRRPASRILRSRARDPPVSRAPFRPVDDRRPGPRRRPAVRRDRRGAAAATARPPPGQRRPPRPAGRGAGRRGRRSLPARRADARRPGAPMGPCTRTRTRRSTSTSRPTASRAPTSRGRSAGSSARLRLEGVRRRVRRPAARADAVRAPGGSLQAAAGDGRQHQPGGRPVRRPGRRAASPVLEAATERAGRRRPGRRRRRSAIACGPCRPTGTQAAAVAPLLAAASRGPVTIADGHHRYETALRYRDERRMSRSCEEDPAFDYILTLFLEATTQPLTVLPTHRILRGLGEAGVGRAPRRSRRAVRGPPPWTTRASCGATFDAIALAEGGAGRFGLWTAIGGASPDGRSAAHSSLHAVAWRRGRARRST